MKINNLELKIPCTSMGFIAIRVTAALFYYFTPSLSEQAMRLFPGACMLDNNDYLVSATPSAEGLMDQCEQHTGFLCRSFDLYYLQNDPATASGHLAANDRITQPEKFSSPCYAAGLSYGDFTGADHSWTAIDPGCLQTNSAVVAVGKGNSVQNCKQACEAETTFTCLSIELEGTECRLSPRARFNSAAGEFSAPCGSNANIFYGERNQKVLSYSLYQLGLKGVAGSEMKELVCRSSGGPGLCFLDCSRKCTTTSGCRAFSVNSETSSCRLYERNAGVLASETDSKYEMWTAYDSILP